MDMACLLFDGDSSCEYHQRLSGQRAIDIAMVQLVIALQSAQLLLCRDVGLIRRDSFTGICSSPLLSQHAGRANRGR